MILRKLPVAFMFSSPNSQNDGSLSIINFAFEYRMILVISYEQNQNNLRKSIFAQFKITDRLKIIVPQNCTTDFLCSF